MIMRLDMWHCIFISAIGDEKVSVAMQTARAVRECIDMIENATGKPIDVLSLSYNRLMNYEVYGSACIYRREAEPGYE